MDIQQLLVLLTVAPIMMGLVVDSASTIGIPTAIGSAGSPRQGVVAHYNGGALAQGTHAQCRAQVRSMHAYHRSIGWAGIGYHGLQCRHGVHMTGRGINRVGAHAPGVNATRVGIQFMLGGTQVPTHDMLRGFREWLVWAAARGIRTSVITGHRDHTSTSCPGTNVYGRVRSGNWGSGGTTPPPVAIQYWNLDGLLVPTGAVMLMRGMSGVPIERLQTAMLRYMPTLLPQHKADGDFGAETEQSMRLMQRALGVTDDGVYGGVTAAALRRALEGAATTPPPVSVPDLEEMIDMGRAEHWEVTLEQELPVGQPYAVRWDTSDTNSAVSPENRYATFLFSGRRFAGTASLRVVPRAALGGSWEELAFRVEVGQVPADAAQASEPRSSWGSGIYRTSEANHAVDGAAGQGQRLRLWVTALSPGLVLTSATLHGLSAARD
jgi:peptidoglycan hydrolase-like protein with peptidoglycan-binding domain